MKIDFIFVATTGGIHTLITNVVRDVTNSKYSHVAIRFEDCIIEAKLPKVCKTNDITLYDNESTVDIISFEVSEVKYKEIYDLALTQLSKWYGLDDCVIGGLHDLFDIHIDNLDLTGTIDCSALGVLLGRCIVPDLLGYEDISAITPGSLNTAMHNVQEGGLYNV